MHRGAVARRVAVTAAILGVIGLAFAAGFILFARTVASYNPSPANRGEAIVVLTGGELRLVAAAKLLSDGRGARLLISGVNPQTTLESLKRISKLSDRLFDCCVDIDFASSTTGNADETKAWAQARGFKRLILVTSSYHMPRSLVELRRAMPGVTLIPYPVVPHRLHAQRWWTDAYTARVLVWEYVKFLPSAARYSIARVMRWESGAG
jgi:uncharacterized SAM-binding protein YcdF (DUF218 family)